MARQVLKQGNLRITLFAHESNISQFFHVFLGVVSFDIGQLGKALFFQTRNSGIACPCQEARRGFAGFELPFLF